MFIQRIYRDSDFWDNTMLPKLQAFYMQGLLPELACPQEEKCSGIREPGIWVSLKIYDIRTHFLNSSTKVSIYSCSKYMYFPLRAQIPLKTIIL